MLHSFELHHAGCSQAVSAEVSARMGAGLPLHGQEEEAVGRSVRSSHLLGEEARLSSLGMLTVGHQWVLSKEKLSLSSPPL